MNTPESKPESIDHYEHISVATAYVYVLSRPKHPNFSKVGYTKISAKSRANNYTDGEWQIYEEFPMPSFLARLTEKSAHQQLTEYWFDPKITGGTANEIFVCPPDVASIAVQLAKDEAQKQIVTALGLPANTFDIINKITLNSLYNNYKNNTQNSNLLERAKEDFKNKELYFRQKISDLENENKFLKDYKGTSNTFLEDELKKANLYYSRKISDLEKIINDYKSKIKPAIQEVISSNKDSEDSSGTPKTLHKHIDELSKRILELEKINFGLLNPILIEMDISYEELKNISKNIQSSSNNKIRYKLIEAIELASKYRALLPKKID